MCFDMRFVKTAEYAKNNGFKIITSSLGISRWKNMEQITDCGNKAAALFEGVEYWDYNWRKHGGSERMYKIAKREQFYKQEYCGCIYSLRDTNQWREKNNREKIVIGEEYYEEKISG
jgi:predicted adenine nucleotide alpha hydrolase (AANH) superfamily ATPase